MTVTLGVYANRNSHSDFVVNAIESLSNDGCNVHAAVAFFTEPDVVENLLAKGCFVRLIVRLGFPTSPDALERLIGRPGAEIRYFTGHSFHPKLYLFGDQCALVGSANLTRNAIVSNQEVVVTIDSLDDRLEELSTIFTDYWDEARVLDSAALAVYRAAYAQYARLQGDINKAADALLRKLGETQPSNIEREKLQVKKEFRFIEDFRRPIRNA